MTDVPLKDRPDYEQDRDHPLVAAVRRLREEHDLAGCVLISFTSERVGVDSSGATEEFGRVMHRLGDEILKAIDDDKFNPERLMAN